MILGLDASTHATGWSVFDRDQLIDYGVITASSTDLIQRIKHMQQEFEKILDKYDIETIVMEDVIPKAGSHTANPTVWRALTYLQAAIAFLVHDKYGNRAKLEFVTASQWRKECGIKTGRGVTRDQLKKADIAFVKTKFDIDTTSDDLADSICIGYSKAKYAKNAW